MFISKKKRIRNYLDSMKKEQWSPFEMLLDDFLSGKLPDRLAEYEISKPSFHIDFLEDYKCISIQGKHKSCYIDIQIEQNEFSIACDPDEADDHKYYRLESPEQFYSVLRDEIQSLRSV